MVGRSPGCWEYTDTGHESSACQRTGRLPGRPNGAKTGTRKPLLADSVEWPGSAHWALNLYILKSTGVSQASIARHEIASSNAALNHKKQMDALSHTRHKQ
jgi:hypothetical protein